MIFPSRLSEKFHSIEPLAGDASTRRYFRLHAKKGRDCIAVIYPEGEEGFESSRRLIEATRYLQKHRVPVPRLLGAQKRGSLLLVEDFGATHLADVGKGSERAAWNLYRPALDILVSLHGVATEALPSSSHAAQNALDEARLFSELEHTYRFFVRGLLKASLPAPKELALLDGFRAVARRAARQPWVLCHRDYHSRNLMVREKTLGVLDHQDMCRGPYTYDLASLLRDSYASLSDRFRHKAMDYFLTRSKKRWNRRPFLEDFEYSALQRNLKALGTFAFQKVEKGTSRYLPYVAPTLRHVWQNLRRFDEEFQGMSAVLRECVAKAVTEKNPLKSAGRAA